MLPSLSGVSWLALLSTTTFLSGVTLSHAQPLPKRVSAALVKASLNFSKPPRSLSIALATSPLGSPPPLGDMTVQNREWLAWPPPLLRTGPCRFSGSVLSFFTSSSTGRSAYSVPSSAALTLLMYVWWCLVWWIFIVSVSMCGSSAS